MSEVLVKAIEAHGGMDRWNRAIGITANLSIGGVLLDSKRQSGVFGRVRLEADLHNQHVVLKYLGKSGLAATFTPEQLTVPILRSSST
jgi:hypothetical protein